MESAALLSARIARHIARLAPVYAPPTRPEEGFADAGSRARRLLAPLAHDPALAQVMHRLCVDLGLYRDASDAYLTRLFGAARRFPAEAFTADPYLQAVTPPEVREGDFLLTRAGYAAYELFAYDVPDLSDPACTPRLGVCTRPFTFPALYEGVMPWMSVCPSEMASMRGPIQRARGRVLVLGLGLGYFPFRILAKPEVQRVTVVESSPQVIRLFRRALAPFFPGPDRLQIIEADALRFLARVKEDEYDACFADIWENQVDGAIYYPLIAEQAARLSATHFDYWIEDAIRWQLQQTNGTDETGGSY